MNQHDYDLRPQQPPQQPPYGQQPANQAPPPGGWDHADYPPAYDESPPTSLKVFGIILIVIGVLGVFCCLPLGALGSWSAIQQGQEPLLMQVFMVADTVIRVILAIAALGIGIGLLQRRELARKAALGWGVLTLGLLSISMVVGLWQRWQMIPAAGPDMMPQRIGFVIGALIAAATIILFPILLIAFMVKPAVRDACR